MTGERTRGDAARGEAAIISTLFEVGAMSPSFDALADTYAEHCGSLDATAVRFIALVALDVDMSRRTHAPDPTTMHFDDATGAISRRLHARTYNATLDALWRECNGSGDLVALAATALTITNARIPA